MEKSASFSRIVSSPLGRAGLSESTGSAPVDLESICCDWPGLVPLVLSPVGLGEIGLEDPSGLFLAPLMGSHVHSHVPAVPSSYVTESSRLKHWSYLRSQKMCLEAPVPVGPPSPMPTGQAVGAEEEASWKK